MASVLGVFAVLIAYVVWRILRIGRTASAEVDRRWEVDRNLVEVADWFGKTGLSDEDERELPKYLRREFGEVGADDGLRAADLKYLGVQSDDQGAAHFWAIPKSEGDGDYAYAYINIDEHGVPQSYGWGDRRPVLQRPAL
jgi:hypothetical protein